MFKVLITTVPFAENNENLLLLLEQNKIDYYINPHNRKFTYRELEEIIPNFDGVIAGTDVFDNTIISKGKKLKLISRVGVGIENIDYDALSKNNVRLTITPDIPAQSIAELTLGMMISMLRNVHKINLNMHRGKWERLTGRNISEVIIGLIGMGRIGTRLYGMLQSFKPKGIYLNDIALDKTKFNSPNVFFGDIEKICKECDIISIHTPLNETTKDLFKYRELMMMKNDAVLINNSRGGIINEDDLHKVLSSNHLSAVGIDAFENEPYNGKLKEFDRCLLTSHIGSMTKECRKQMELECVENMISFSKQGIIKNELFLNDH